MQTDGGRDIGVFSFYSVPCNFSMLDRASSIEWALDKYSGNQWFVALITISFSSVISGLCISPVKLSTFAQRLYGLLALDACCSLEIEMHLVFSREALTIPLCKMRGSFKSLEHSREKLWLLHRHPHLVSFAPEHTDFRVVFISECRSLMRRCLCVLHNPHN